MMICRKAVKIMTVASSISLLILLGIISDQQVKAQTASDNPGFYLNNSFLGARSAAMANTQVSDAYSLEGIYTNPASFLFSDSNISTAINTFYSQTYNVIVENVTGVITRNNQQLFGIGATVQHKGPGNTIPLHSSYQQVNFTQFGLSVMYAALVRSTFSIGAGLSASYGMAGQDSEWAMISNIGVFYAPSSAISYGLSYSGLGGGGLKNLGGGILYTYEEFPADGETADRNGTTQLTLERVPHRLEIGATLRYPTMSRQPDFKLSFANEKIFGERGLIYKGGLELYPVDMIALRGGYLYSTFAKGVRLGIGLILGRIIIDYSFSEAMTGLKGDAHLLSISMEF